MGNLKTEITETFGKLKCKVHLNFAICLETEKQMVKPRVLKNNYKLCGILQNFFKFEKKSRQKKRSIFRRIPHPPTPIPTCPPGSEAPLRPRRRSARPVVRRRPVRRCGPPGERPAEPPEREPRRAGLGTFTLY